MTCGRVHRTGGSRHRKRQQQRPGDDLPAAQRSATDRRRWHSPPRRTRPREPAVRRRSRSARRRREAQRSRRPRPPAMPHSQKPKEGRSPANTTLIAAVASGNIPSTTPPCEAGAVCMAIAESSGKPSTTPAAIATSRAALGAVGNRSFRQPQHRGGDRRGDDRTSEADEHGWQLGDRKARERQGEAEQGDRGEAVADSRGWLPKGRACGKACTEAASPDKRRAGGGESRIRYCPAPCRSGPASSRY